MAGGPTLQDARDRVDSLINAAGFGRCIAPKVFRFVLYNRRFYADPNMLLKHLALRKEDEDDPVEEDPPEGKLYCLIRDAHNRETTQRHVKDSLVLNRVERNFDAFLYSILELEDWELVCFANIADIARLAAEFECQVLKKEVVRMLEYATKKDPCLDSMHGAIAYSDLKLLGVWYYSCFVTFIYVFMVHSSRCRGGVLH